MGRVTTFDDVTVYRAVGRDLALNGRTTIASLQALTGLSSGSLYHRFGSREQLMAEAWLHTIGLFQELAAKGMAKGGLGGAVEVALATPQFCRSERDLGMLLVCGRPAEFLTDALTPDQKAALDALNRQAAKRISSLALELDRPVMECRLALVAFPLGAVRTFMPGADVPRSVDATIRKAVLAILG